MTSLEPMPAAPGIAGELALLVSSSTVIHANEPLTKRTTLRVGGPADVLIEPASESDLSAILRWCSSRGVNFFVLGRGSNLLVRDGGFRGVVICLPAAAFGRIEIKGERLQCGAGAKLKNVANEARRAGLSGVEFLEGIPGSVGGALRMNAGAMGSATFNGVERIRVMTPDGVGMELSPGEFEVGYRNCPLLKSHVALGAVFKCRVSTPEAVAQRMTEFSQKRWSSQPPKPSAGCMFKNPTQCPAGKLIDELGLKGTRVGGAVVSDEHGNFIVNDGAATAQDVLELIAILKERVRTERGIELHTEVEIIGED
jgi:UDP-N-acetylenolpyruvoylglucosamine reductase